MKEKKVLKAIVKIVTVEVRTHPTPVIKLNGSLDKELNSLKTLEKEMFVLKDYLVDIFDLYFEQAKK